MIESDICQRVIPRFLLLGLDPLAVKANRRSGKTSIVCFLAATLAPMRRVCIVSTSKFTAMVCARNVAALLPDSEIVGDQIRIGDGWVHCGTKVVDADVVLVDDAQYMCPVMYEDIIRLMGVKPVLLVGTPTGHPNNIFARICSLKDTQGTYVCNVIDARQRISSI